MASRPTVLASIVLGLALLGDSLLYAVLPLHASTFGVSLAWTGVLLSANRVTRLFVYPWLPRVASTGSRRFTATAAAVAALSTLAFAAGRGAWVLLASRMAWGAVFGALSLSAMAYATERGNDAGKRVGLSLSLRELGPFLALTAGTALVAQAGVRPALAVLGIVSLLGVQVALALPDRKATKSEQPPDVLRKPGSDDWRSAAAGLVTDGIFPATVGLLLVESSGTGAAVVGAGMLLAFRRIAIVVLAPIAGFAADAFGGNAVTSAGFVVSATGALSIAYGSALSGALLISCGGAVMAASIPISVSEREPAERVGALARLAIARDAGAATGPLLALLLFDRAGAASLYLASAALMLGCAGAALARRSPAGAPAAH